MVPAEVVTDILMLSEPHAEHLRVLSRHGSLEAPQ
jgi:hypothetical protein